VLCVVFVAGWSVAACEISLITPSSGLAGDTLTVSVQGVGFSFIEFVGDQGFDISFGPGIQATVTNLLPLTTVPLPQEIVVDLAIDVAATPGPRTVTVTSLANEQFCSQQGFTVTAPGSTENVPPLAQFSFVPSTPHVGEVVSFDASGSVDPDGQIVQYLWDFGDGTFGQGVSTSHTYLRPESYVVALTVVDDQGAEGVTTQPVVLQEGNPDNLPPVADFVFTPDSPGVGDAVRFDASDSFDLDGEIVQFLWNFGDGDVGEGVSPTHVYVLSGSYLVGLTVVDNDGLIDAAEEEIFVPELPSPVETSCDVKVGGKFESAQGVWQDDIIFPDAPTKQLTTISPNNYVAELKLVENRPTLLFGAKDTNHKKIHVDVTTTGGGNVILQSVIKLSDSKGERELFRGPITTFPCTTPGQVHHDFDLDTSNGIPTKFFTVAAGSYHVWIEVNKVGSPEMAGKITVSGQAVKTHSPKVLFVEFALNRGSLTSTQRGGLQRATKALNSASQKFIPDYFPLKPKGFRSQVFGTNFVLTLRTGEVGPLNLPANIKTPKKIMKFVRNHVSGSILAKIENNFFTTPRKFASAKERRVVLVMPKDDFKTLRPNDVAVTFGTPHKVIFAQANTPGSHWDIAHELTHSLPLTSGTLWSPEPACTKNYHNTTDKVGAGHRITLGGAENRKRLDKVTSIMGNAKVPQWITQCTYWHLLNVFSKPTIPDPELLLIRGYLLDMKSEGNGMTGWLIPALTDQGTPSELPAQGSFFVVLRDQNGNELARRPFEPFWQYSDGTAAPIVSINLAVPKPAGTTQIELHGLQGLLHTLSAGPTPPSVRIQNVDVNSGKVTWTGNDADGDSLSYILMASDDNGETWLPLDETEATQLDVSPDLLQSPDLQLKIVATDGINTGSETVKSPFPHGGGDTTGKQTIEQALDTNDNNVIDDAEIRTAIQLWISGQVVPGTNRTIDDEEIRRLIQLWISGGPVTAQAQALVTSAPLRLDRVSITSEHGQFALSVAGQGIRRIQLQVFGLDGRRLLDETNAGSQLRFEVVDTAGRRWANGVYLYVVTVYGEHGSTLRSELHKFVVLR